MSSRFHSDAEHGIDRVSNYGSIPFSLQNPVDSSLRRPIPNSHFPYPRALVLAALVAATAIVATSLLLSSIGPLVSLVLSLGFGLLLASRFSEFDVRYFLLVFCVSAFVTIAIYWHFDSIFGAPYWGGGSDDLQFEEWSRDFVDRYGLLSYNSITSGRLYSPSTLTTAYTLNAPGYIYFASVASLLADFFGADFSFLLRFLNASFLALICLTIRSLLIQLDVSSEVASRAGLLAGLHPLMLYMSAFSLRDTLISLLVAAFSLVGILAVLRRIQLLPFVALSLLLVLVVGQLRIGQAYVLASAFAFGLLLRSGPGRLGSIRTLQILLGIVLSVTAIFVIQSGLMADVQRFFDAADRYTVRRSEITGGGLSLLVFEATGIVGSLLRTIYLLISPLPFLFNSPTQVFLSLGTTLGLVLSIHLLRGVRLALESASRFWLLVLLSQLYLGVALFTFTIRQIVTFLPLAIALGATGYRISDGGMRLWAGFVLAGIGIAGLLYNFAL